MKPPLDAERVPCSAAPDAWHPETGDQAQTKLAKHLCRTRCPLVEQCAEWGIRHERDGVWGGLSPDERKKIRKARGIVVDTPVTGVAYPQRRTGGPEHGDEAGYKRHLRRREEPCRACHLGNLRARQDRAKRAAS